MAEASTAEAIVPFVFVASMWLSRKRMGRVWSRKISSGNAIRALLFVSTVPVCIACFSAFAFPTAFRGGSLQYFIFTPYFSPFPTCWIIWSAMCPTKRIKSVKPLSLRYSMQRSMSGLPATFRSAFGLSMSPILFAVPPANMITCVLAVSRCMVSRIFGFIFVLCANYVFLVTCCLFVGRGLLGGLGLVLCFLGLLVVLG